VSGRGSVSAGRRGAHRLVQEHPDSPGNMSGSIFDHVAAVNGVYSLAAIADVAAAGARKRGNSLMSRSDF